MSDLLLRRELFHIASTDGVLNESIYCFSRMEGQTVTIGFRLSSGTPVNVREPRVFECEDVELLYPVEGVGRKFPLVTFKRPDFPNDLGHVAIASKIGCVVPCLSETGIQPIYDQWGVSGIVRRLRAWLRDARTGSLMVEGWEPAPVLHDEKVSPAIFTAAAFQEFVQSSTNGRAYGVTEARGHWRAPSAALLEPPAARVYAEDATAIRDALLRRRANDRPNHELRGWIPWMLVWSDSDIPVRVPGFGDWKSLGEMKAALEPMGIAATLEAGLVDLVAHKLARRDGGYCAVVLVAIRRPTPIHQNVFGCSKLPAARQFEIRPYFLSSFTESGLRDDNSPVSIMTGFPIVTPELLGWTSRGPTPRDLPAYSIIGAGALGSAIGEHLIRSGATKLAVVDADFLAPHNLARHIGRFSQLGRHKAEILRDIAEGVLHESGEGLVAAHVSTLEMLTYDEQAALVVQGGVLLDTSASDQVRTLLSSSGSPISGPIVRMELRHRGRLGLQFVTGMDGNPNLVDLFADLCFAATIHPLIAEWLRDEQEGGLGDEILVLSAGCASATTRMPASVVSGHVSAFMPTLLDLMPADAPPGIGINSLDTNFRPQGWLQVPGAPRRVLRKPDWGGWEIRLAQTAESTIARELEQARPNEVGGYLYGTIDHTLQKVTVVAAAPLPQGSHATPNAISMGAEGNTSLERAIRAKCKGRIYVVGSWHTHPLGPAEMSDVDLATFARIRAADSETGIPTLFLIAGPEGVAAHFEA